MVVYQKRVAYSYANMKQVSDFPKSILRHAKESLLFSTYIAIRVIPPQGFAPNPTLRQSAREREFELFIPKQTALNNK